MQTRAFWNILGTEGTTQRATLTCYQKEGKNRFLNQLCSEYFIVWVIKDGCRVNLGCVAG